MKFLRRAYGMYAKHVTELTEIEPSQRLSPEARERIKNSLRKFTGNE